MARWEIVKENRENSRPDFFFKNEQLRAPEMNMTPQNFDLQGTRKHVPSAVDLKLDASTSWRKTSILRPNEEDLKKLAEKLVKDI